jgi:hypothetical protein
VLLGNSVFPLLFFFFLLASSALRHITAFPFSSVRSFLPVLPLKSPSPLSVKHPKGEEFFDIVDF